jgi:arylsulfatase A-like enzyme
MQALVVTLRGLHLGNLGCYGNAWIDTPALDGLAAEGVVFDQHLADCPDAVAARRTWHTGRYLFPPAETEPKPPDDLLQLLRRHGVRTSLVIDGSRETPAAFAQGWDHVRQVSADGDDGTVLERTLEAAGDALDELTGQEHWLLWLDLATLLPPWDVPQEYAQAYIQPPRLDGSEDEEDIEQERFASLPDPKPGPLEAPSDVTFSRLKRSYAAAVSYVDAGIGLLLEELSERGLGEDMLLVVTTDHGQALGEHAIVGPYRPWLHDELVHLPLLIRLPRGAEAGRRIAALTQPVDLFPTLLDAFGVAVPSCHGQSLLPLVRGETKAIRTYACSGLRLADREEWALRTPEWAFLLPITFPADEPPRSPQLYVKPDDRCEVNNVLQHHLELGEQLEQTLRSFVTATRQPGPLLVPELVTSQSGGPIS